MWAAFAKYKNQAMNWRHVTNMGMPFMGEKGIMELLVEKMEEKYPDIEYKLEEVTNGNQ